MNLLTVAGVSKKEKDVFTVKDVNFIQQPFQKIGIAGETGSGKTSLLKMIGGLLQPDAGEIHFDQEKVLGPNYQLIPGQAGIAYLSQHFELRSNYWVHEILSYANELTRQQADALYLTCRIDHLLERRTDQLSGGEKQRIALARILIGLPRLLLLDEPFSNLDALHKKIIKTVIDDINAKLGISCIMVSHEATDLLSWADTLLVMKAGMVVQQAGPLDIYRQPADEYCAGLFGEYNLFNAGDAALLYAGETLIPNGKKLLVRPEQLLIDLPGNGLAATVEHILFMGSYYSIEVSTASQKVKVKTNDLHVIKGAAVSLSLLKHSNWFI